MAGRWIGTCRRARIAEVAAYCETDVVNTYRVWLVYELFRGTLSRPEFDGSEANLLQFVTDRVSAKPHLEALLSGSPPHPRTFDGSEPRLPRATWPLEQPRAEVL